MRRKNSFKKDTCKKNIKGTDTGQKSKKKIIPKKNRPKRLVQRLFESQIRKGAGPMKRYDTLQNINPRMRRGLPPILFFF